MIVIMVHGSIDQKKPEFCSNEFFSSSQCLIGTDVPTAHDYAQSFGPGLQDIMANFILLDCSNISD